MKENNRVIKQEAKSHPGSPNSQSRSPKSTDDSDRKFGMDEKEGILKEINDENGNSGSPRKEVAEEENDVDILKEKLRQLEDNSKCSKCLVRAGIELNTCQK